MEDLGYEIPHIPDVVEDNAYRTIDGALTGGLYVGGGFLASKLLTKAVDKTRDASIRRGMGHRELSDVLRNQHALAESQGLSLKTPLRSYVPGSDTSIGKVGDEYLLNARFVNGKGPTHAEIFTELGRATQPRFLQRLSSPNKKLLMAGGIGSGLLAGALNSNGLSEESEAGAKALTGAISVASTGALAATVAAHLKGRQMLKAHLASQGIAYKGSKFWQDVGIQRLRGFFGSSYRLGGLGLAGGYLAASGGRRIPQNTEE